MIQPQKGKKVLKVFSNSFWQDFSFLDYKIEKNFFEIFINASSQYFEKLIFFVSIFAPRKNFTYKIYSKIDIFQSPIIVATGSNRLLKNYVICGPTYKNICNRSILEDNFYHDNWKQFNAWRIETCDAYKYEQFFLNMRQKFEIVVQITHIEVKSFWSRFFLTEFRQLTCY